MVNFKPIKILHSQLESYPLKEGQIIYTTDCIGTYLDITNTQRIKITDITVITDKERNDLLAPADGFYYTSDNKKLWYFSKEWNCLNDDPDLGESAITYEDIEELTDLVSGETISDAFSKLKLAVSRFKTHSQDYTNPHRVSKSQIGLGKVENKSSEEIRSEITYEDVTGALGYVPPIKDTTYGVATSSVPGMILSGNHIYVGTDGKVTVTGGTAEKLKTARTITLEGDVVGTATAFDGSQDIIIQTTVEGLDVDVSWDSLVGKPDVFTPAAHTHTPAEAGVIDGSVAPTSGEIAVFDGTTGKIKSTGFTVEKSVPADAAFTDTVYSHPVYTAQDIELYRISVDATGHVNSVEPVTKDMVVGLAGLDKVENKSGAEIRSELTKEEVVAALGYTPPESAGSVVDIATETVPGTVKSGGDITVSADGSVFVNDNSHGHTIENVNGLQGVLDGKAPINHGSHVYKGNTAPSDTNSIWIDTSAGGAVKYHNGSSWVAGTATAVWG